MTFGILSSKGQRKTGPSAAWIRDHTFLLDDQRIPMTLDEGNLALIASIGSGRSMLLQAYVESVLRDIPEEPNQ